MGGAHIAVPLAIKRPLRWGCGSLQRYTMPGLAGRTQDGHRAAERGAARRTEATTEGAELREPVLVGGSLHASAAAGIGARRGVRDLVLEQRAVSVPFARVVERRKAAADRCRGGRRSRGRWRGRGRSLRRYKWRDLARCCAGVGRCRLSWREIAREQQRARQSESESHGGSIPAKAIDKIVVPIATP